MNAPIEITATLAKFHTVPLASCAPSPTNPRKDFPAKEQAELVDSIRQHGLLQPILVRPWNERTHPNPLSDEAVHYEIVAGERRWRAAQEIGLEEIDVRLRVLTDLEVLEIQIIENLQRQDLHPLDEAEGYERIMATHAYTAEQLGEKIGKSKAYIYARLKLLALSEDARRLFRAGLLTASTALLVARVPTEKLQAKAMQEITTKDYQGDLPSVREAQRLLQRRYMLRLAEAPFPTAACEACPKRTGNAPELFDDVDSADVCTDPDCFAEKKAAHAEQLRQEAEARGLEIIAGKAAEKIAPYGTQYSSDIKGFVKLDQVCQDDPEKRTVREILTDAVSPTLIEDTRQATFVEVVPQKVLAEKLKAAGITTRTEKDQAEQKKKAAKVAEEKAWRQRLYSNIENEVADKIGRDAKIGPRGLGLYRILAERFYRTAGRDAQDKIASQWEAIGKNSTDRIAAFGNGIAAMSFPDCILLLTNLATIDALSVPEWMDDPKCPEYFLTLATVFDIDPDDIRKDIKAEFKAEKDAKKPAKAKKKTPAPTAEKAPSPSKAAPAAGSKRAKKRPAVAFAHPENFDLCWSGRGKKPKWVEHWLAQGGTLEQLRGAEDQKSELEKNEGQAGLAKGVIESDEEPTGAEAPARLAEGNWVRVKDISIVTGFTRTSAGKTGQVKSVGENAHEQAVVLIDGETEFFYEDELEQVAAPTGGAA